MIRASFSLTLTFAVLACAGSAKPETHPQMANPEASLAPTAAVELPRDAGESAPQDAAPTDADLDSNDASPGPRTAEEWLALHGVTAPPNPLTGHCPRSGPCPDQCNSWWQVASSVDVIECDRAVNAVTLHTSLAIDDHRTLTNAAVYRPVHGKLLRVLDIPIQDIDIENRFSSVKLYLHASPDGSALTLSDDWQKCEIAHDTIREWRTSPVLLHGAPIFDGTYIGTVATRVEKVCASVGTFLWDGNAYRRAPPTARTP